VTFKTFPRIISGNKMKLNNTPHIFEIILTTTAIIVPTDNLITAIEFFHNKTKTRNHGY